MAVSERRMDTPIQDSLSDAWATVVTYLWAPPEPERFLAPNGTVLVTAKDVEDGKASFQRADPDGLRQHVRDGLVFRRGLHGEISCPSRRADRRQYRTSPDARAPRIDRA